MRASQLILRIAASALLVGLATSMAPTPAYAQITGLNPNQPDPCARANRRLAERGRGDRDFDGISNCTERKVTGTSLRDPDTDNDGVDDGDEVENGTDPLDIDSDDDGLSDGDEDRFGTDPLDPDSDHDGLKDGDDPDPAKQLECAIEGPVDGIDCPSGQQDGGITVLGIAISLKTTTEYDGAENCSDLSSRFHAHGAHVEVSLIDEIFGSDIDCVLEAREVDLDDADNDGSPDRVDPDDDNDGSPDVDDVDDDGDGVPDAEDADHED